MKSIAYILIAYEVLWQSSGWSVLWTQRPDKAACWGTGPSSCSRNPATPGTRRQGRCYSHTPQKPAAKRQLDGTGTARPCGCSCTHGRRKPRQLSRRCLFETWSSHGEAKAATKAETPKAAPTQARTTSSFR